MTWICLKCGQMVEPDISGVGRRVDKDFCNYCSRARPSGKVYREL